MIHIGDYGGSKYDYVRRFVRYRSFKEDYGIKLKNFDQCPEALFNPFES